MGWAGEIETRMCGTAHISLPATLSEEWIRLYADPPARWAPLATATCRPWDRGINGSVLLWQLLVRAGEFLHRIHRRDVLPGGRRTGRCYASRAAWLSLSSIGRVRGAVTTD